MSGIVGEWKIFVFKRVEVCDIEKILEFFRSDFFGHEPLHQLCPPDEDYIKFSNSRVAKKLETDGKYCIIALDKVSNEIAGLQCCFKWTKEESKAQINSMRTIDESAMTNIPQLRKVHELCYKDLEDAKMSVFDKYNVEYVAWNFLVSTGVKYRGQGLATTMFNEMNHLLKKDGFEIIIGIYSSPFSRRCAVKTGFVEVDRVQFADVKDENGQLVLPKATKDDCASFMIKKL